MAKAKNLDSQTLELIEEVKRQKADIAQTEGWVWKTNCTFSYVEGDAAKTVNLHIVNDVRELIKMVAHVLGQEANYKAAAHIMEVQAPPFTWCSFSASDWIADIKAKINRVQLAAKRRKLEVFENKLNGLMSSDLRTKMELDSIMAELKS